MVRQLIQDKTNELWESPTPEEDKHFSLEDRFAELEKTLANKHEGKDNWNSKKLSTKKQGRENNAGKKRNRKEKAAWMSVKPADAYLKNYENAMECSGIGANMKQ